MSTIGSLPSVQGNSGVQSVASSAQPNNTTAIPDSDDAVSVSMSKRAQLFSSLDSLASSDPEKFKAVTSKIADQLRQAAANETGGGADAMNKLADRFSAASQSGQTADLAPPAAHAHHGHHGGHHHAHASGDASSGQGQGGVNGRAQVANSIDSIISAAISGNST